MNSADETVPAQAMTLTDDTAMERERNRVPVIERMMDMLELITGIHERTGIPIPEGEVKPEWSLSELIAELGRR